jgi:hypothetical protein
VLENGRERLLPQEQSAGTVDAGPDFLRIFAAYLRRRSFRGQTQNLMPRLRWFPGTGAVWFRRSVKGAERQSARVGTRRGPASVADRRVYHFADVRMPVLIALGGSSS